MAQHCIDSSDLEARVLRWLTDTFNAENHTTLTADQFLQLNFPMLMRPYVLRYKQEVKRRLNANFDGLTDEEVEAQIKALLGIQI